MTELEKKIEEMENTLSDVDEQIIELTDEVKQREEVKADLLVDKGLGILKSKKDLHDASEKVTNLYRDLDDKKVLRVRLGEKIEIAREELREEKVKHLSQKCDSLEKAYSEVADEVGELEKKLSTLRDAGADFHKCWDVIQAEIIKLGGQAKDPEKVFGLKRIGMNIV